MNSMATAHMSYVSFVEKQPFVYSDKEIVYINDLFSKCILRISVKNFTANGEERIPDQWSIDGSVAQAGLQSAV